MSKASRRPVTAEELRELQLDMLQLVDRICREHQIEYTLAAGTLLGAIRHGGYIPWDDDIDIELARPEYQRLIAVLRNHLPPHLGLLHFSARPTYIGFAKVYDKRTGFTSSLDTLNRGTGVFIDIFPVDGVPTEQPAQDQFLKEIIRAGRRLAASSPHGLDYASASRALFRIAKMILWLPAHLRYLGRGNALARQLDELMKSHPFENARQVGFLAMLIRPAIMPQQIYLEYADVVFEHLSLRKLVDHHTYLKSMYGDYMTLPPESARQTHAYYHWYWRSPQASQSG